MTFMILKMKKVIIQITSGKGPIECCRVVSMVQHMILKQAKSNSIDISVASSLKGDINGTLISSTLIAEGKDVNILKEWEGTIQWISKSPYRLMEKRKNWFVGVSFFDTNNLIDFKLKDVEITTCRSGGPGGQSVNTTNSAVRAKHIPTGIQVFTQDSRSMLENKKLCIDRLKNKVLELQTKQATDNQQSQWQEHNILERGNPVKVFNIILKK